MRLIYDRQEILADGVIHAIGVLMAIVGAVVIVGMTVYHAGPGDMASALIYVTCLNITLAMSAIYNMWPVNVLKNHLRKFDHAAIYLLIAGTYTPFAARMDEQGALLLAFIWLVAIVGMALKLFAPGRFDRVAIGLCLALGWSGVMIYDTAVASLPPVVLGLILAGGISYTLGVIFHVWERLRFQNAIWHAFVLVGAGLHYAAVMAAIITPSVAA